METPMSFSTVEEAEQFLLARVKEGGDEGAFWALMRLYSQTGRQPLALRYVDQMAQATTEPGKKACCYLKMGQLMEQMEDYEAAITYYSQAFGLEPTDTETWYYINNNLGYCLNHFGRYAEAERYCQTAIQVIPQRHNAYKNLGVSLEGQGQYTQAARCYIAAFQANAGDPRSLRHLEKLLFVHPEVAEEIPELLAMVKHLRDQKDS